MDKAIKKFDDYSSAIKGIYPFGQFIQRNEKQPLYEKITKSEAFLNGLETLTSKWIDIKNSWKSSTKLAKYSKFTNMFALLNESGLMLDLFLNNKIPTSNYLQSVIFRVSFLSQYELMIQQFVKPLFYSYNNSRLNGDYHSQSKMIKFCKLYNLDKYSRIFSLLHSDLRNSIAPKLFCVSKKIV